MRKKKQWKIIPDYGDPEDLDVRAKYGYLEAFVSIAGNALLVLIKVFLGLFINSIALVADGVHSLSDISTSGIVIFGFRIAKKKPDKEHPYGHGRAEYIATLIIAILLIVVGFSFIEQSISRIINIEQIQHGELAIIIVIIVLFSAVAKEIMARYSNAISKKINSDVLKADAWHHRSDAISSIGVAIGILGSTFGYPILDPIFGLLVSFIIIYVGINLIRNSSNFLIGQGPNKELIKKIKKIAKNTEKIKGVHDISLHDYGTTKIVTLHAELDSNLTLEKAHSIADLLEKNIHNETKLSTIIHLDPSSTSANIKGKIKIIKTILEKQKDIKSFHKIHIIHSGDKYIYKMHLVVDKDMPVEDSHKLCHYLTEIIEEIYGPCDVDIHFEPCINDCSICNIKCIKKSN